MKNLPGFLFAFGLLLCRWLAVMFGAVACGALLVVITGALSVCVPVGAVVWWARDVFRAVVSVARAAK